MKCPLNIFYLLTTFLICQFSWCPYQNKYDGSVFQEELRNIDNFQMIEAKDPFTWFLAAGPLARIYCHGQF